MLNNLFIILLFFLFCFYFYFDESALSAWIKSLGVRRIQHDVRVVLVIDAPSFQPVV